MDDRKFGALAPRGLFNALVLTCAFVAGMWLVGMPSSALLPTVAVPQADDDVVLEFNRFFKKYKDAPTRVEAVLALDGTDTIGVAEALLPVLIDEFPTVADAAIQILSGLKAEPPVLYLLERMEKEKKGPLLEALLEVMAGGHFVAAAPMTIEFLESRHWPVRRRAVLAVTAIQVANAEALATAEIDSAAALMPLTQDKEVAVRCAALEGLAILKSELVLTPAKADLLHESWQVRVSAIRALGMVRHVDSIGPLLDCMEREEGRLIEDAAWSLTELTGQNYGLRIPLWRRFWDTWSERYELPTDEELAKKMAAIAETDLRYNPREGDAAFGGVDTPSRSILFVIDVSGSMDDKISEVAKFRTAGHTEFRRIDIVKRELSRTIENLESYVQFNILTFATDMSAWKKKQVRANVLNKSSALSWIARLEPIGGTSKQDLHQVGLIGSANLEGGKTNTHLALMTALGVLPAGRRETEYEVKIDTIFFLSDGLPSMGELIEIEDLLRSVRVENELRKIAIHAIGIGSFQKAFLRRLASENGGKFVDLGK
ncbi:MAG: HEAT repeat protein [Planctomycetota bacterium]|jgi:HEAT repeat protein